MNEALDANSLSITDTEISSLFSNCISKFDDDLKGFGPKPTNTKASNNLLARHFQGFGANNDIGNQPPITTSF